MEQYVHYISLVYLSVLVWAQLYGSLPTYGGATYVRWGRKTCSTGSKVIYSGETAGPHAGAKSGGTNYQCLPADPEYYITNIPSKAYQSTLRPMQYWVIDMPDLKHLQHLNVPCVACETNQRVTMLMIPAMTRCPTSEWHLEYRGYLMSEIEHGGGKEGQDDLGKFALDTRSFTSYICVDKESESLTPKPRPAEDLWGGGFLHPVEADCTGENKLRSCPPYRGDNSALACVVCSK